MTDLKEATTSEWDGDGGVFELLESLSVFDAAVGESYDFKSGAEFRSSASTIMLGGLPNHPASATYSDAAKELGRDVEGLAYFLPVRPRFE